MSFTPNPDRDSLPLKKRDQRLSSLSHQQQECEAATFKAPYPYKSRNECKTKHTSPFQPLPRRVPALYQPWMQIHTSSTTRSKPQVLSAFKEHHGWAEWREFNPLHPGWDFPYHHQHQLPGTPAVHPHHPSRFSPISLVSEGFRHREGYNWEQLKTLRDKSFNAERQSNSRNKGPYVRRRDRKVEYFSRFERASPPSLSTCRPHPAHEDQHDLLYTPTNIVPQLVSEHSLRRVSCSDNSNSTYTSMKEDTSTLPSSEHASPSPDRFPWLLPHFVAGSLIELRDGRLRRVEHLQTEDFLLGSLACPDLRLSCCTVQSISPSAYNSSSSLSRLLILLHDQQTQELVDVYVEYPFFVRGQGWSSCSPQRTACLCGLQCRQLSVGDVCLALTPVSAPSQPSLSATLEPKTSRLKSERGCEPPKVSHPHVVPGPQWPSGEKKKEEVKTVRRRRYSAPELRGPGTNCMK
ncbi:uncharacterized protein LOC118103457 [Hippoglossus stenolepis]|uniref:uncharacterized protein LOC118103457 n=1 Tax=Hippoglossus stenolepis TaxID=195615 RepID=UPI00159C1DAC|nr:uncharacterized protein LOC118103457 [Hippoglossus stenolepis]